ncbi:MAG: hypothetical protein U0176_24475 [Bacteroidia bacterium]
MNTENVTSAQQPGGKWDIPVSKWALWIAAFVVFLIVMTGKVRYTEGDARYSLFSTKALIENGSLRLDDYMQELDLSALNNDHNWMIFRAGDAGHYYYDYPIGTQIFSAPFVWISCRFGMDPVQIPDDTSMQIGLSALICVAIFLLLYRLSRHFLGEWAALLFSITFFLGSTFTSTLGTALWSHNFQTLFIMLAILELVDFERGVRSRIRGPLLGFLLFSAYLCRPTSAAFILPVFAYLAWRERNALIWAGAVAGGFFAWFLIWSWLELGMLLPRYYDPTQWRTTNEFWAHLMPVWFGPARGLWSFTPLLLLAFGVWAVRKLRFHPLNLLVWVWLLLHTYLLLGSQSPWAGWSFGPRFFTEVLPGLALLLLMLSEQASGFHRRVQAGLAVAFLVLGGFGIYVHTFQGLHNVQTMSWNDSPNIDQRWADRRWDWRHPQFLASENQRRKLALESSTSLLMQQLSPRFPASSNLLYLPQEPTIREAFHQWNREDKFGRKQQLCNSLYAVHKTGNPEFYFTSSQLPDLRGIPGIYLDTLSATRLTMGAFLKAHEQYEIFIAAKDDATTSLALESRQYMNSIGSKLDSVKLRDSYIAHIYKGKLVHEEWGQRDITYLARAKVTVKVHSAGLFVGNGASILLNGQECSLNQRGMNVLVLNDSREIVWNTSFDTHADDHERVVLMKGKLLPSPQP